MKKFHHAYLAAILVLMPMLATAQSLWHDDISKSMFADKRASSVGDILTVIVQENTVANKNNQTSTEKKSGLTAAISSFLYPGFVQYKGANPSVSYSSDMKHDGSGTINNSESIVAHIAVRVTDVLPNGNLIIEGKRETSFSGENQTILLHGVVRAADVSAQNTVLSYNVTDAKIEIIGKGTVTDSQRKGWFTRILEKVYPF